MRVPIDKELEKLSKEDKKRREINPSNDVKLLLEGDKTEEARILRGLSSNSQFNRIENVRGRQIELENLENEYEGKVFKIEQIEKLCVDYRLRFLQSRLFTGSYDVEVASKIKDFALNTNTSIDDYTLGRRFYVMAPDKMFELKDEKYVSKAELRKQLDPAIFYQIDNTHFRLIHKWGNDFTVFRLIEGFRWKSWWNHQLMNTLSASPIIAFLFILCIPSPAIFVDEHPILLTLIVAVISFVLVWFLDGMWLQDEGDSIKGYFSKTNWDSESKIRR